MANPEGALALLILLDQYPRSASRGTAHVFATDPLACFYARQMAHAEMDKQIESALRMICYLPFEHSESADDQRLSLRLNRELEQKGFRGVVMRLVIR